MTTSLVRNARQMMTRRIAYKQEQVMNKLVLKEKTSSQWVGRWREPGLVLLISDPDLSLSSSVLF